MAECEAHRERLVEMDERRDEGKDDDDPLQEAELGDGLAHAAEE
jgi:hypothetical protein